MLTLLILTVSFTPEHGPFMFQRFWFLAIAEMAVEAACLRAMAKGIR
jgi:hypothetical protein